MSRDQVIALKDYVPRSVRSPLLLGALRPSDSKTTWIDEAQDAVAEGRRVVLSGHIESFGEIAKAIRSLTDKHPSARFALVLHWTQALENRPSAEDLCLFNSVYTAVDEEISSAQVQGIIRNWCPEWILIPRTGLNWNAWIPTTLLPERRGLVHILSPSTIDNHESGEFLSPDELRLHLADFAHEHPLIHFTAPPHEWFVASELGPWRLESRRASVANVTHENRRLSQYTLSIIVPFRWNGLEIETERLRENLRSIAETFSAHESAEIIISVDRDASTPAFTAVDVGLDLADTVFVESVREDGFNEWRAGFIRNAGSRMARNRDGVFLFIDSDIVVSRPEVLRMTLAETFAIAQNEILMLSTLREDPEFQVATSSLLAIRSPLFRKLGGFAEAFHHYGCEDNFLIWQARQNGVKAVALETAVVRHIRDRLDTDDLAVKMSRLRPSADLMYRMTLDETVHQHFFVSLAPELWTRAALKRLASNSFARIFIAPVIFALTLVEIESRTAYLRGFYAFAIWKFKRPLLWVRDAIWSQRWILKNPTAWFELRTPMFYRYAWRPLLKCRYFLEYHLLTRWRSL